MSFLETLYDSDLRRIFTILIYEPSSTSITTPQGPTMDPARSRLYRVNQAVDVEWLISNEWSAEAGNMVISREFHHHRRPDVTDALQSAELPRSRNEFALRYDHVHMTFGFGRLLSKWMRRQIVVKSTASTSSGRV